MLNGKKILVGVTGSIAAYKIAELVRLFVKSDAEVRVIMTPSASDFISALTLSTLSKNPVLSTFTSGEDGEWNNHVELGLWADIFIVAPATANSIAKMARGISDNLLIATYLSARCPVCIAPAMDLDMYQHPSTKENLQHLDAHQVRIIDAEYGELASGLTGKGRMAEPEAIHQFVEEFFDKGLPLNGKTVLVTAGPTQEKIDPVRFIGNHSSGKMGIAIARKLRMEGAKVHLVLGPVSQSFDLTGLNVSHVVSADEMYTAALALFDSADVAVLAAAVADFKPESASGSKIKKSSGGMDIKLTQTTDIAKELGTLKKENQRIVGFALETDNEVENATKKLESKNFDMVVLNSLNDAGAGFGHDSNKITIIKKGNKLIEFELKSKEEVASDIVNSIVEII